MNTIEITGKQVFSLKADSTGNPYKGQLAGQTYAKIPYNGKLIIVNESSQFYKELIAGEVHTLWISEYQDMVADANGVEKPVTRYRINGHINRTENARFKESTVEEMILDAKIDALVKASLKPEAKISEETAKDLESA
jgi:hypothetical protein